MKKYALTAGGLFGFGIFLHFLNAVDFESLLHAVPIFVTWFTITVTFVLFVLEDYEIQARMPGYGWKIRLTKNDAYELLKVSLGYQVIFHILLFINYPVFEAILSLAALGYFLHRYREV
jgi:hypothetical protein